MVYYNTVLKWEKMSVNWPRRSQNKPVRNGAVLNSWVLYYDSTNERGEGIALMIEGRTQAKSYL